ncbi:leucine-rich repeat neuronal protein 1-like [Penaeus japonicus]|uniref:leucine-rich repeat neuronal protein 1-like n=1 Tax=Penaeus japonicus TaxID=27405 RepID=UPI001C70E0A0|nr:leucine-rich repeat neuronal protein 1-like [Penaeus japonicus]
MMMPFLQSVAVMVAVTSYATLARDLQSICSTCACLPTSTEVDCRNRDFREIPDLSQDRVNYTWTLDLSNNMIRSITKFPSLPNLAELHIQKNYPSTIEDSAFANLDSLKTLNLRNNDLTHDAIREGVFEGRYSQNSSFPLALEVLDLSYNNFSLLPRNCFRHLPVLKKLILAHNPLGDLSHATSMAINELHSLIELDLSQTGIDRLPHSFLTDLLNLQVLILAGNNIQRVPEEINYGRSLVHLNLNANPIEIVQEGDFTNKSSGLRRLDMSAMPKLKTIGRHAFSNLKSLEVLHLSNCPNLLVIDNEAFYQLDPKETLKEVHIQANRLSSLNENMLPWMNIKYVDIQDNPWNCDCNLKWVAEKLLPHLEENPGTTLSLLCTDPLEYRGETLAKVLEDENGFQCPYSHSFTKRGMYGPLVLSTIIVGIILLVAGSVIFAYALYRRTRIGARFGESVKYRRAHDEDDESCPNTIHT